MALDASLEEIAPQAGVGIGTLYRHFPTREHLVEVVYRREAESAVHGRRRAGCFTTRPMSRSNNGCSASSTTSPPSAGWRQSLRILLSTNSALFSDVSGRVTLALRRLIEAAVADGSIRSDVSASDVLHALGGIVLGHPTPRTGATARAGWYRC